MESNDNTKVIIEDDDVIPNLPKSDQNAKLIMPDGREFEFPILKPTIGPEVIDIRNLYTKTGYFTFDPAFMSTASCASKITFIDGDKGTLLYRGYRIEDLAEKSSYIEVCYLLLYGVLPSKKELKKFEETIIKEMMVHEKLIHFYKGFKDDAHPMAILTGVFGALSAFYHDNLDIFNKKDRELAAIRIIAKLPTIAAIAFRTSNGLPIVYPKKEYGFIENFLYMMFADNNNTEWHCHPDIVRAMDIIFLLHADHEQNASTSTVRIAGSSLANPYACVASGITSLWGPAHGGANEAVLNMLEEIGSVENVPKVISEAKDKNSTFRLMGFGHRVYKNYDPRARLMQEQCHKVLNVVQKDQPLLDLAKKLEEAALKDDYFIKRKLYPNVDFYTGIIYNSIGIPKNMFTAMFAAARSVGWISQWMEMMSEGSIRIGRPRQLYVGDNIKDYVPVDERKKEKKSRVPDKTGKVGDVLASIKLS